VGMNKNEHPQKISCAGGFYAWDSDQEIPNLEVATFEYADGTIMELEVRSLPNPRNENGLLYLGTKGYALLEGNTFKAFLGSDKEPAINITEKDLEVNVRRDEFSKADIDFHFVNFIDAVKSRNHKDLVADVLEGHISTTMMHLGNIAYRTGRKLIFDGKTEKFVNDKNANTYLARQEERKPYILPREV